jgi:hypothetical protein
MLPQELKADLLRLYASDIPVPPERNEAILLMARRQMVRRQRVRVLIRRMTAVAAAAAVIALAVLLTRPEHPAAHRPEMAAGPDRRTVTAPNEPNRALPIQARAPAPNEPKAASMPAGSLAAVPPHVTPGPVPATRSAVALRQADHSPATLRQADHSPATLKQAERGPQPLASLKAPDRNARVTILDAFTLARMIERSRTGIGNTNADEERTWETLRHPQGHALTPPPAGPDTASRQTNPPALSGWDFNGDGVIDQKDVDALAMAAVKLKGGAS